MFTDDAVTPVRIEILVDLLRHHPRGLAREDTYRLLQPKALDPSPSLTPAKATVRAALELGLAEESGGTLSLSDSGKRLKEARAVVLNAFDEKVMVGTEVEKYFALFYAYLLFLGKEVHLRARQSDEEWAKQFNKVVLLGEVQKNPFNKDKVSDLTNTWFIYAGLGWKDPAGYFQANPYERLVRALPVLFGKKRKLTSPEFMQALAETCPELDGGELFQQANRAWKSEEKQCTLGLSHALIELHEDEVLRLDCPADCQEWSLKEAEPPRDDAFKGDRFASVEWRKS
jgi:hypothetical protein